jgi:23S rRNA pseudoU1915 N3-methylase RlmH
LKEGNGVLTGGAPGVDYFCKKEVLKQKKLNYLRVIIPRKLDDYVKHYQETRQSRGLSVKVIQDLENILRIIYNQSPASILEMPHEVLTQNEFNERNTEEIKYGDEVYAFQVNGSTGTQDTIDKALKRGLKISLHKKYTI